MKRRTLQRWALRLPGAMWWRRGHGAASHEVSSFADATLYKTAVAAQCAATRAGLLDTYSTYTLLEVIVQTTGQGKDFDAHEVE